MAPLTHKGLCWTLWFLRVYPTDMEILALVHSNASFYRVVWNYVYLLAQLLPQVREHSEISIEISLTPSHCSHHLTSGLHTMQALMT